jgi:hypothetical protein
MLKNKIKFLQLLKYVVPFFAAGIFFALAPSASAADRYWVGGTGNWDNTTTHWSATSGGASGASVPTSVDNVFFNAASGTGFLVNIATVAANCLDLTMSNSTMSMTGTVGLNIYGSATFAAGMSNSFTGAIGFYATTTGKTITMNGVSLASTIQILGVGGGWQLQDAFVTSSNVNFSAGTFDTNNQSVSSTTFTTAAIGKTLRLGTTTWTLTGNSSTLWSWTTNSSSFIDGRRATLISNYAGSAGTRTFAMNSEITNPSLSITGGTDSVTLQSISYVNNLDFTGFNGAVPITSGSVSVYGNITLSAGMTNSASTFTMVATSARNVNTQSSSGNANVVFSADGSKAYLLSSLTDSVFQYELPVPWDISSSYYAGATKSVATQSTSPIGISFSSDGTKMYMSTASVAGVVYQYALSTAWNVSTAVYSTLVNISAQVGVSTEQIDFSNDGSKMYALSGSGTFYQYTLSTPWDVSTATYASISKSVMAQSNQMYGMDFSSDGTKLYTASYNSDKIYQYTLSTPWNVSTATNTSFVSVTYTNHLIMGITVSSDGTKLYSIGGGSQALKDILQYSFGTAWDITSLGLTVQNKTITSNGNFFQRGVVFNGMGGNWTLQDNFTTNGTFLTLTNGTVNSNNKTVSFTGAGSAVITGAFSFYNLTRTGTAVNTDELVFANDITIANNLTLTGNSSGNKITVRSSVSGTQRIVTAASVTLNDVRFKDVDAAGAAIPWTGVRLIDLGNNLDINFSAIIIRYWVGGSGNWSDATNHWAATSGGAPGITNMPGQDENVVFDNLSNATSYTLTIDAAAYCRDFNLGNPNSGTLTLAGSQPITISGSSVMATGMTNSYTGAIAYNAIVPGKTVTSNGVSFASAITFGGLGGSWQLQDALATTGAIVFSNGTLDTNSQSVSSLNFTATSGIRTLSLGTTTWTITGNASTVWNWSISTSAMSGKNATIVSNYAGATGTRTITMGNDQNNPSLSVSSGTDIVILSAAYMNNLNFLGFGGTWSASSGALTLFGNLTFGNTINSNTATITMAATSRNSNLQDISPNGLFFNSSGTILYVMGNSNDTVTQYMLSTPWDVSTASYSMKSKNVSAQDTSPLDVFISADGTKMYVMGNFNDTVFQYTLSTAWDVSTATYSSLSKSVTAQESDPTSVTFTADGTKMYIIGTITNTVYQYTLSTPWDVSTATYSSISKSTATEGNVSYALNFTTDGTKMFVVSAANKAIYQYTLSTPWDVSTATFSFLSKNVSAQGANIFGAAFSNDGTKMYVVGNMNRAIYQYTLSTAWDVSTANLIVTNKTISSNGRNLYCPITFNGDSTTTWQFQDAFTTTGTVTFSNGILDTNSQSVTSSTFTATTGVRTLNLGTTLWTLTGSNTNLWTWSDTSSDIRNNQAIIRSNYAGSVGWRTVDMGSNPNNPSLWITAGTDIFQTGIGYISMHDLNFTGFSGTWSTSIPNSIFGKLTLSSSMTNNNTAEIIMASTSVKNISTQTASSYDFVFSSDGTKMYVLASAGTIYQYTVSTPWDTSTADYLGVSKIITDQESSALGMNFNSDGTKMYIIGNSKKTVFQYTLATAWDVTTAFYTGLNKLVSAQENNPYKAVFSTDGTKMYVMGSTPTIYQYTVSTPWDVSTATYASISKNVTAQTAISYGFGFSPDGTKMYVMGASSNIYPYTLSTPWNVSTATYASVFKDVGGEELFPVNIRFNSNGLMMYLLGTNQRSVIQYNLSTPYDVSSAILVQNSLESITSNGKSIKNLTFNGIGGYWKLLDTLTIDPTYILTLTSGRFDDNNKNISTPNFSSSGSNSRTIVKNQNATWNLTGTGTVWDTSTFDHLTINDAGTIKITDISASAKTFSGGFGNFGNLWNAQGAGAGTLTINGSNSFNEFKSDANTTVLFTAGTTQTVNFFTLGNSVTLGSTTTSPFFLVKNGPGSIFVNNLLSVSYSTVTPANTWYAGIGGDGGFNSGWIFNNPPKRSSVRGTAKFKGSVKVK